MREIKFRAWDKKGDGMFYDIQNGITFDDESRYTMDDFLNPKSDDCHEWEIMQFTGLHDKNDNPIYEGDIVFCKVRDSGDKEYEGSYEIYWGKDFGYCFREKDYEHGLPLSWTGYESVEVIGNIYEDTNYLKEHGANNN